MAHITIRLLCPKSSLHRRVLSPFPCFYSTSKECSKLVQTECPTPSKDLNNLSTRSNPPKLFEIFAQQRSQRPTPSADISALIDTRSPLDKHMNIFRIESDPQKLVQIFKQSAKQRSFRRLRFPYEVAVKKLASLKQFDAIEEILDHSMQEGDFDAAYKYYNESMRRNWIPNLDTAKMLIDCLFKNNKVESAREVIEGMKKQLPASYHRELENIS